MCVLIILINITIYWLRQSPRQHLTTTRSSCCRAATHLMNKVVTSSRSGSLPLHPPTQPPPGLTLPGLFCFIVTAGLIITAALLSLLGRVSGWIALWKLGILPVSYFKICTSTFLVFCFVICSIRLVYFRLVIVSGYELRRTYKSVIKADYYRISM